MTSNYKMSRRLLSLFLAFYSTVIFRSIILRAAKQAINPNTFHCFQITIEAMGPLFKDATTYCVDHYESDVPAQTLKDEALQQLRYYKREYSDRMHKHANYLSHYKTYKNMHDFDIELGIGERLIGNIQYHHPGGDVGRLEACETFVKQINKTVATIERRFQLIIADAFLVIEFDVTTRTQDWKTRKINLRKYFDQYAERSNNLFWDSDWREVFESDKEHYCDDYLALLKHKKDEIKDSPIVQKQFNARVGKLYSEMRMVMYDFIFQFK